MIALGSDHGGYPLKERVKAYLDQAGIPYQDFGCDSTDSCDYPIYGKAAAEAVDKSLPWWKRFAFRYLLGLY